MTDTDTDTDLVVPAAPDPVELRAKLRAKVAKVRGETARLEAVQAGRDRAREQQRELRPKLREVEAVLASALRDDPLHAAYAFVNGVDGDTADDTAAAKAEFATLSAEVGRLENIEQALTDEAARVEDDLRFTRARSYQAQAEVVAASAEYKFLCDEHVATFRRLRSIKEALRVIGNTLQGHLDQQFASDPAYTQPMAERVGYDCDDTPEKWRISLEGLSRDADAELPSPPGMIPADLPPPTARNGRSNGRNGHRAAK